MFFLVYLTCDPGAPKACLNIFCCYNYKNASLRQALPIKGRMRCTLENHRFLCLRTEQIIITFLLYNEEKAWNKSHEGKLLKQSSGCACIVSWKSRMLLKSLVGHEEHFRTFEGIVSPKKSARVRVPGDKLASCNCSYYKYFCMKVV